MRDINRIEPLLEEFKLIWKSSPDLRMGQIICCLAKNKDVFNIEDYELMERIKEWKLENETERR